MADAGTQPAEAPADLVGVVRNIVAICRMAGIRFQVRGEDLVIDFDEIDWAYWPPMRRRLECLGGLKLVRYLEGQEGFRRARARRKAELEAAGFQPRRSRALEDLAASLRKSSW